MATDKHNAGGNPVQDWHPIQGGLELLLVTSYYRNRNKLRPDEPISWFTDLTLPSREQNEKR